MIYNCISFISVIRTYPDTGPYLWESDQSPINFTFADFGSITWPNKLRAQAGLSSGFQRFKPVGGGWITPTPETGNEMFISFYALKTALCPLYCEKSGIFVTIILVTKVYNIP